MADATRSCGSCGTDNTEDARFCDGCGGSLARVCGACGAEARAEARFCRNCGKPLEARSAAPTVAAGPVRKTVTVMFADLAGSTSFEERVDAETAREVIGRYHGLLRATAQRHRAGVTKYIGDGFMAVWGVPETGADDAGHAVDAAVELQALFVDLAARVAEAHGVDLALRVAVNTGEVVVGEGDADLVGDALNVGARLEAECPRGRVVVGEETWRSTRGQHRYDALGPVRVKGRTTPVAVFQWLGHRSESATAAPFVGRADEVRRLQGALDDATRARTARMVTVIGDPGVGKTRLAAAFIEAQPSLRVIRTRCHVEETVALAPIVELLRARDLDADVPVATPERDRVLRDLTGLAAGVPGSVEETFWALRRFVEALAIDQPLLIVLDDLQWADTLLFDFVEHLVEWVSDVPVLVVALARPELRELRADFVAVSRWVTQAVHLGGLDATETAELAAEVVGGARLPEELLQRLPSSTGGNPLFVRELIGMLVDDEVLVHDPGGWRLTIDVDAITIPPTIHALLASRLERLDAVDRRVLEIASVLGTDFSLGAVSVLAGTDAAAIKPSLDRLRRLQLAQPSGAYLGDEAVWRFHHVLIRDIAYRRLLKSDRADLHERLADWVETGGATLASDADELVARHLEAAHGYRVELGTLDDGACGLALRSARGYLASSRRALDRDELASAGSQAERGAALAAADDAVRAELLLIGCEAYLSAGDVATCAPLVDELERVAGDVLVPWATCYRCQFIVYTEPERLLEVDDRLQDAIDEFGRRKDAAGLAKAHRVRAGARARLGRIGDCESDLLEALIAARRSGDQRQITAALSAAPSAALWGPSPVPKAGGRCLDVVRMQRMATAAPSLEATSLRCLAVLELLRGRPDKARSMLADARQVVADLGLRHGLMETELFAGIIESMVGDPVAAEPHFRAALEGLDALGVGADAGLAAALLARSVLEQGRVDDADGYAAESERLAGHNLKTAVAWRTVRSEILCAQDDYVEAIALARDAVAIAMGTDLVLDHADACLTLSRALAAAGDSRGADGARRDAEALYAAKEVVGSISRTVAPALPVDTNVAVHPTTSSRLARTNRASEVTSAAITALQARDVDGAVRCFSDDHVVDDRRRWLGNLIRDFRTGLERVLEQYSHLDWRTLAVRGERLHMCSSTWSDDSENESTYLHVFELGGDGLINHEVRFDGDDFEAAYRELERRYYAGEGAEFAVHGHVLTEWLAALDRLDVEAAHGLAQPEFRWFTVPSALSSTEHTVDDLFRWLQARRHQVSSVRHRISAIRWLSPNCCVGVGDAWAVGLEGENFEWTRLYVGEYRDGLLASVRQFELDDEGAAFAHAEQTMLATTRRLAVTNRASEASTRVIMAMAARDIDAVVACFSDRWVYDDRRALSGGPVASGGALRAATERILQQYSHFEGCTLAVRGERLQLGRSRWSDEAGNETTYLHVYELGDDERVSYEGRFDGDDFEAAYRELERRYYEGEGAEFAAGGALMTEVMSALNQGDFDRTFSHFAPEFVAENRSRSMFGDRSAAQMRTSNEELSPMIASARSWVSAVCWLSPNWAVFYYEREAVGLDGEQYAWTRLVVGDIRDGQVKSMCQFEDEEAAFAYAEVRATARRLAMSNRASATMQAATRAMAAHDVDAVVDFYSLDRFVFDDRRGLSGDPIEGHAAIRSAAERVLEQFPYSEGRVTAVRGDRLVLGRMRRWDDAGNETVQRVVSELGEDGRIEYEGRFDDQDFEGAYRELERRYYAGEGATFARNGALPTEWITAVNRGDFDRVFGELAAPEFRLESRSGTVFGGRSADEARASFEDLAAMVASVREWLAAICWLSPNVSVSHFEREAVGLDGEQYSWTRLVVSVARKDRVALMCDFDPADEQLAFAYGEEKVRDTTGRLTVANRATDVWHRLGSAMAAHDVDGAIACLSADQFVQDDRRGLSGDPIEGSAALRTAAERILQQYCHFDARMLAVRGQRLALSRIRWADDAGNETVQLELCELGDDGCIVYDGRFDEDDFEGAYRELERRYYASEGLAFAAGGAVPTEWMAAYNRGDFDMAFGELSSAGFRLETRSSSVFGDRSAAELRGTFEELSSMVGSVRGWLSSIYWLSPTVSVSRFEREAVGLDDEQYSWTRLMVAEVGNERVNSMCDFDPDAEEEAFAYAEDLVAAVTSRLAVANRASASFHGVTRAMAAHDVGSAMGHYSSQRFVYDDRRPFSGGQIEDLAAFRAAAERVLEQYCHFDGRVLAVRGERLALGRSRWSDDAGNETIQLVLHELGDDGRIEYEGRFDEDGFAVAFGELEHRYYAGEGAAYAAGGAVASKVVIALNGGELDQAFAELLTPDFRATSRSLSVFGDRSATEFRASIEELGAMVASVRTWYSAVRWLSPSWVVYRSAREAVGFDGEQYAWTPLYVSEFRDGRLASNCQFDPDDEQAAFAYAEERMRATASRLPRTNRASQVSDGLGRAMATLDVGAAVAQFSDGYIDDDRRAWRGDPVAGGAPLRAALERVLGQYPHFEWRTLAVRGERLALAGTRLSDDAGNETTQLDVFEIDDDGRIICAVRFDTDDFEAAYRELERRYFAGEGAAFAAGGAVQTEYFVALTRGDLDKVFGDLTTPDFRMTSRSRSVFGDRSAAEVRASVEELSAMVASARTWISAVRWLSPACSVDRFEREAVGLDGERYAWTRLTVNELRDGRVASVCEFDVEDEEEAFAYAEQLVAARPSRLAKSNGASHTVEAMVTALCAHDVDAAMVHYAERFGYGDHRRLTGGPIRGRAELQAAFERIFQQYSRFEWNVLAVRGDGLILYWSRWSDDAGNESRYLHVDEIDGDGQFSYEGRFDEDDFEGAYRELERRYRAGEGAEFAEGIACAADWVVAVNGGDFDKAFGELMAPDYRVESRSRSVLGNRSAAELRVSFDELQSLVARSRSWNAAVCWLSPTLAVNRFEREAVGIDGQQFVWERIHVAEFRAGRIASACEFELDDEDEAFAYAESLIAAQPSRLSVVNLATENERRVCDLVGNPEFDSAALDFMHEKFRIVDRRAMSGEPFVGRATGLVNLRRLLADYPNLDIVPLAVRGERLALVEYRGRTPGGYEATYLNVNELDASGRLVEQVRFDGDDFEGAYRELEQRYYGGEGAAFAAGGAMTTEQVTAMNRGDFDSAFGELMSPDFRLTSRSRSAFGDRSAAQTRAALEELGAMVSSVRMWFAAVRWLSPACSVIRQERKAVGPDGEEFSWTRLYVCEVDGGRVASMCEFELENEDEAFVYAEELAAVRPGRLAVDNAATKSERHVGDLRGRPEFDSALSNFLHEDFRVDDRRTMPAAPCLGREAGIVGFHRLLDDYPDLEVVPLAVRGQRLALVEWRCRSEDGFEATYLNVHEFDEDAQLVEQVRFDGDDFEGAYRELENRYYAGEGAAFAAGGALQTEYVIATNRGEFDTVFGDLIVPDAHVTSRSRSAFGDRSAAEVRASLEELVAMVASVRTWYSAVCWLSPSCYMVRMERAAIGLDGEQYAWTRLYVGELQDERLASLCEFELEDERDAFAYAEELAAPRG